MYNNGVDFNSMMAQVEAGMRQQNNEAFGKDPANPNRVVVVNPTEILKRELSTVEQEMMRKIQNMDQYSWNRGKNGGLKTGFDLFDQGIEGGLQSGLILFAASPNVGKSAIMLQIMKQVAHLNENAYCEYISLDDSLNELMPRWIANDQHITIAQAKNPERFEEEPDILEKRNEGIKNLYRGVNKFSMRDSDGGTSVEDIEARIKELKMTLPEGTKIVLGIDSFYDLTSQQVSGDKVLEHIAKVVKTWTTLYDVVVMCTAHLRKLNGNRRPTNDDLKETNRLEYEANLILLLYNEVGIKEEGAEIYWLHEDEELKMPVVEMKFSKNKFGSYKGTRFYEFIPDYSYFMESTAEACKRYASLIYQR